MTKCNDVHLVVMRQYPDFKVYFKRLNLFFSLITTCNDVHLTVTRQYPAFQVAIF